MKFRDATKSVVDFLLNAVQSMFSSVKIKPGIYSEFSMEELAKLAYSLDDSILKQWANGDIKLYFVEVPSSKVPRNLCDVSDRERVGFLVQTDKEGKTEFVHAMVEWDSLSEELSRHLSEGSGAVELCKGFEEDFCNAAVSVTYAGALENEDPAGILREYFEQGFCKTNMDITEQLCLTIGLPQENIVKKLTQIGDHYYLFNDRDNKLSLSQKSLIVSKLSSLLAQLKYPKSIFVLLTVGEKNMQSESTKKEAQEKDSEEVRVDWQAVTPKYHRHQWIVSEQANKQFDDAVSIIHQRERIYDKWGFSEVDPNARAVLCFYGQPGTGKSMGAHVLASELGMPIICASYAQIESKFMGQSPKRLRSVFAAAQEKKAVLFFDEADSFLGKRIENVSQSADQAVNSLRGEMLILLEDFEGIVIFATNLHSNFDKAFDSRVLSHIKFDLPNQDARIAIIKSKIPSKAPLAEEVNDALFAELASLSDGFSGRELKNAVFMGLVKAAQRASREGNEYIYAAELVEAFKEMKATRESLAADRQAHGGTVKIAPQEQKSLLNLATEKINEKKEV